ncbi:MAG: PEP-CTERM sorting domain-containing protein [Gammaproteobacteria bacterium]|nr:PEP-CTERM sorting domain-containing protein [Gammaproteobacteria bacterium]
MKATIIKGLATAILLLPFAANAVPIDGSIGLGGDMDLTCSGGGTCTVNNADGIAFIGNGNVNSVSGDFATTILVGDDALMNDFGFDPLDLNNPLWAVGGFSFAITAIDSINRIDTSGADFLLLSGSGLISAAGFDDTLGTWTFSADSADGIDFAWSSTAAPSPAPEPGILMLLGMGLIGSIGARRLVRI